MLFVILGLVDTIGGAILFFSSTNSTITAIGAALALKGLWSLASDAFYLFHGES